MPAPQALWSKNNANTKALTAIWKKGSRQKVLHPQEASFSLWLHYRVTFSILLICGMMTAFYSFFDISDSAIQCYSDRDDTSLPEELLNRYCWMKSTFTLPKYFDNKPEEKTSIYPGVGPFTEKDEKIYHAYYQWVPLFLFFQCICFYASHALWKFWEGGKFKKLIASLEVVRKNENKGAAIKEDSKTRPCLILLIATLENFELTEIEEVKGVLAQIDLPSLALAKRAFYKKGLAYIEAEENYLRRKKSLYRIELALIGFEVCYWCPISRVEKKRRSAEKALDDIDLALNVLAQRKKCEKELIERVMYQIRLVKTALFCIELARSALAERRLLFTKLTTRDLPEELSSALSVLAKIYSLLSEWLENVEGNPFPPQPDNLAFAGVVKIILESMTGTPFEDMVADICALPLEERIPAMEHYLCNGKPINLRQVVKYFKGKTIGHTVVKYLLDTFSDIDTTALMKYIEEKPKCNCAKGVKCTSEEGNDEKLKYIEKKPKCNCAKGANCTSEEGNDEKLNYTKDGVMKFYNLSLFRRLCKAQRFKTIGYTVVKYLVEPLCYVDTTALMKYIEEILKCNCVKGTKCTSEEGSDQKLNCTEDDMKFNNLSLFRRLYEDQRFKTIGYTVVKYLLEPLCYIDTTALMKYIEEKLKCNCAKGAKCTSEEGIDEKVKYTDDNPKCNCAKGAKCTSKERIDKKVKNIEEKVKKCHNLSLFRRLYKDERFIITSSNSVPTNQHNEFRSLDLKHYLCEIFSVGNVLFQMCLTNVFLGGNFFSYGFKATKALILCDEQGADIFLHIFPTMTKCTLQKFGPSGTIENVDALCVLPVNVINEKIFFVLWFWFILLACWSIADLGFQTYLMFKPSYRPRFLRWLKLNGMTDVDIMEYRNFMDESVEHFNWFDWVILYDYGHHSGPTDEWRSISNLLRLIDALFNKDMRQMQRKHWKQMEQRLDANPAFPPIQWVGGKCNEECEDFIDEEPWKQVNQSG